LSCSSHQESNSDEIEATSLLLHLVHDLEADEPREEQFILLEERTAHILVQAPCELGDEVGFTLRLACLVDNAFDRLNGALINQAEELQRVLVHVVNIDQVSQHEE